MKKIQVALCITDLDRGGAEQCLVRLATGLDRDRFVPTVYCLAPRPRNENSCLPPLEKAGIVTHCLGGKSKWHFPIIVSRLARLFRKNRPHVVQSFLFHANVVAAWAAHRSGVRPVIAGIRVAEHRTSFPLRGDRCFDRWIDRYVCVSKSVADFYRTKTGTSLEKLLVIPNGIDLTSYPTHNTQTTQTLDLSGLGIAPQRRLVCFVGRLEPQKGVCWLVKTAGEWLDKLPDHDLLIVGAGSQRNELEKIAKSRNIDNRVHFAGWRGDVPRILARGELLVLPSAWEGMPNVVMEAMASGLPVVACDVEGVGELLGPLSGPQMIVPGDTLALTEKITSLVSNPEFAHVIGKQNRSRIEQNFSLAKMIRAYQHLWESLVGSAKNS